MFYFLIGIVLDLEYVLENICLLGRNYFGCQMCSAGSVPSISIDFIDFLLIF